MKSVIAFLVEFVEWAVIVWAWISMCSPRAIWSSPVDFVANNRVLQWYRHELRPFIIPLGIVAYFGHIYVESGDSDSIFNWSAILSLVFSCIYWYLDRDEDNRWKRRRKKLKEKITVKAGRLAVEPTS